MMNKKGWLSIFLGVVIFLIFSVVILVVIYTLSFILKITLDDTVQVEQGFIPPFLIGYSEAGMEYNEKDFFQQVTYFASGEKYHTSFDEMARERAMLVSNAYILAFNDKFLSNYGEINEQKIFSAMIPVLAFEKKSKKLVITAS